ncbi:decarboxylase [Pseudomonas sp. LLC-1]|uniref:pyridoxal phosphate-dependent decarboxylase family protein n=1 Tax=Pseudomonas sp. LLC-1 TaxID=1812180 RepID=UPI000D020C76|nr:pyridoxal-dependent decarboxylase [Pseudomonas sp. LLC-1]PRN02978.1 decarboxylase [Pseudomonas sp. LLC-1]
MPGTEGTPSLRILSGRGVEEFRSFAMFAGKGSRAVEAWFLGPRGENAELFERLVVEAVRDQVYWRRNFHPEDPSHITEAIKRSPEYLDGLSCLEEGYSGLLAFLKKSVPFFSMRYQGHMNWETTLPGILGYFAAMLYNPNNVAFEGSTATTILEGLVGDDLCRMLGYKVPGPDGGVPGDLMPPWGHITCDGTVANIEAVWAARNLKFYPLALRAALAEDGRLASARQKLTVTPAGCETPLPLLSLDDWQVLNLNVDEILGLPSAVATALELDELEGTRLVSDAVAPYSLQTLGYQGFSERLAIGIKSPVIFVPGTKHYSFSKAAALVGIGSAHLSDVCVDADARLDVADLRAKLVKFSNERRPVLMVVAVLGSTEESSVDPLAAVLALRDELRMSHGIDFSVHVDGAFGGYHASVERSDFDMPTPAASFDMGAPLQHSGLSDYCKVQYSVLGQADSITVDPHKSGYIPYPAGALCYRNSRMRSLVTFSAPVVYHGEAEPTVGIYGVEGSKPGAAVSAVYLSHRVIRPSKSGYGLIIGRALYSCKRLYARLLEIGRDDLFYAVPLPRLPASLPGEDERAKTAYLLQHLSRPSGPPPDDFDNHLRTVGPDLNILAYAFNFRLPSGEPNTSLHLANLFNEAMYHELSLKPFEDIYGQDMIVSTTNFERKAYGQAFFDDYTARLGTSDVLGIDHITVLRSVVMDPWVTETGVDVATTDFLDTLETALRRAATAAYGLLNRTT